MSVSSPISPAVDHLADLALWEAELAADRPAAVSSLVRRFASVPDPRSARGRRHPLVVILVLTACATLVSPNQRRSEVRIIFFPVGMIFCMVLFLSSDGQDPIRGNSRSAPGVLSAGMSHQLKIVLDFTTLSSSSERFKNCCI